MRRVPLLSVRCAARSGTPSPAATIPRTGQRSVQDLEPLANPDSPCTQPIAPVLTAVSATAGAADVSPAPAAPSPALRTLCRRLRVPPHCEAAWAASGPHPAWQFCAYFACGILQCALAVAVFGLPSPWSTKLLVVRLVPGWSYIAARALAIGWTWFAGPSRTPAIVTIADALTYSIAGITTCLQPRALVPFQSRFSFSVLNGILVCAGCGTVLMERPGSVRLSFLPLFWALGVRTVRFVDAFTDMAFARLVLEDVRAPLL